MSLKTTIRGIYQSDIIIRSALIFALNELRDHPWELDFVFASFLNDDKTIREYGEKELEQAKAWFLNTDVPVSMSFRFDKITTPLIAISLEDTAEAATTLGDVHYEPTEDVNATELLVTPAPILTFTPKAYDSTTGTVTLPDSLTTANVFAGMVFFDTKSNQGYAIQEVLDAQTFQIQADVNANFSNAVVAPKSAFYVAHLESLEERENYRIDLYVSSNSTHLLYLYAIVKYCLLKYKEEFLEARGYERSAVSSSGLRLFKGENNPEIIYTRTFNVTGYTRQYWVKSVKPKIDGIFAQVHIAEASPTPAAALSEVEQQGWDMESDGIG